MSLFGPSVAENDTLTRTYQEIVNDGQRCWAAYLTLQAVAAARAEIAAEESAAREAAQLAVIATCPLCGLVGEYIQSRGVGSKGNGPRIRTCTACHAVASAHYVAQLGNAKCAAGGTRAEAVDAWLRRHGRATAPDSAEV